MVLLVIMDMNLRKWSAAAAPAVLVVVMFLILRQSLARQFLEKMLAMNLMKMDPVKIAETMLSAAPVVFAEVVMWKSGEKRILKWRLSNDTHFFSCYDIFVWIPF